MTDDKQTAPEQSTEAGGRAEPIVSRGYMARNRDVAKAYGLNAGLCSIRKRMQERTDCPAWLLKSLDDMIDRSNCLLRPLIEHRDELSADPQDVRGYVDTMLGG